MYVQEDKVSISPGTSRLGKQNIKAKEVYTVQSSATRKPGGIQQMFLRRGSIPRTNPLPFIYTFFHEKGTTSV